MRFFDKLRMIERIDHLIKIKATGSARDLAERIQISKSAVYDTIDLMKAMGAEIEYCTHRRSYYYQTDRVLALGYVNKSKIYGGKNSMSSNLGHIEPIFEMSFE